MNIISGEGVGVVLLNIFTVRPENQAALVDCIREGAPADVPGLLSVKLLKGRDGTRVINFMHWESREAFDQATAGNAAIAATRQRVQQLIEKAAPDTYEVIDVR